MSDRLWRGASEVLSENVKEQTLQGSEFESSNTGAGKYFVLMRRACDLFPLIVNCCKKAEKWISKRNSAKVTRLEKYLRILLNWFELTGPYSDQQSTARISRS